MARKGERTAKRWFGHTSDYSEALDAAARDKPWSVADYEALRVAALALVRSHIAVDVPVSADAPTGILTAVGASAYWDLLGALDRRPNLHKGKGAQELL